MSATANIIGDAVRLDFSRPFDAQGHDLFIRAKQLPEARYDFDRELDRYTVTAPARFAHLVGLTPPEIAAAWVPFAAHLFPVQRWIVERALQAKRFAVWADCGFGKTPIALEWARQVHHRTGGRVMVLAPKSILRQWRDEAAKFYPDGSVPLPILESRKEVIDWCHGGSGIAITNWNKWGSRELDAEFMACLRFCAGVVLDESSILKGGGGVIKWNLIKSCRGIEWKLSCTATPAPNDTMEYASQASWLEKLRNEGEILWTYFYRDGNNGWKVRPHAREAFYRFMASWSIYIRRASAYGFDDAFTVEEPEVVEHRLAMTSVQGERMRKFTSAKGTLFADDSMGIAERSKISQLAKGFLYGGTASKRTVEQVDSVKPAVVAKLVRDLMADGKRGLVWTVFDEESEVIMEQLRGVEGVATLHGEDSEEKREAVLEDFRTDRIPWLVSKGVLLGYGMNFPFVDAMIFSGFDDSFEKFYQSVRRGHRYGRKDRLRVHVPIIPDLEAKMWANLMRKQGQWESDIEEQERNYVEAMK